MFLEEVLSMPGGENILACIQCGTCSGSCPTSYQMDHTPRQIINMIRANQKNQVLTSAAIWLCASCYSCTVRCPRGIEITELMYLLKSMSIKEKSLSAKHDSVAFYQIFTDIVGEAGRINEGKLVMNYAMKTGVTKLLTQFAPLGIKLMRRGRVSFVPVKIKNREEFKLLLESVEERSGA